MSFVKWNDKNKCTDSLTAINGLNGYGCPYVLLNGYRMDQWDVMTESFAAGEWGFFAPEDRPGKSKEDLMDLLEPTFTMTDEQPEDWVSEEDED